MVGVTFIRTGWYLALGVVFGVLSFVRTNAYKQRTGSSPWHIHPIFWGIASVFVWMFGTLLSIIACSTSAHSSRERTVPAPDSGYQAVPATTGVPPSRALAAWLTDPTGRHELRYFDGRDWTEHVANSGITSVDRL